MNDNNEPHLLSSNAFYDLKVPLRLGLQPDPVGGVYSAPQTAS